MPQNQVQHRPKRLFVRTPRFFKLGDNHPDTALAQIGMIGMVLNFVVAVAVSKMTKSPPVEIRKLVDSIRVPRGAGDAHAH